MLLYGGLAAVVIGARLAYAAQFYPIYVQTPRLLLSLRPGTLAAIPGLIVGVGVALILLHTRTDTDFDDFGQCGVGIRFCTDRIGTGPVCNR